MEFENLLLNRKGRIATLIINRPKTLNSLSTEILLELDIVIDEIAISDKIDVLIITGCGKSFVAGADIEEMKIMSAVEAGKFANLGVKVFRKIELLDIPVIAAINGFALGGGCELAMCCDIRIASEKARIGQPEVTLGITPGFSGTQRMPRIIGASKAKELIFTGEIIKAEEALQIGLVSRVVAHDDLLDICKELAQKIINNGQLAVRYSKAAINRGFETDIDTGIEIEKNMFALCFATNDQKEGMSAFLEKRTAQFKNR